MSKKYKLIFLKSLLLCGVFTSYINSNPNFEIMKTSLNSLIITDILNEQEVKFYEKEVKKLTVFLSKLVFINSSFIFIDDDKIKVYKKIRKN